MVLNKVSCRYVAVFVSGFHFRYNLIWVRIRSVSELSNFEKMIAQKKNLPETVCHPAADQEEAALASIKKYHKMSFVELKRLN